jgi:hypothetical protein
MSIAGDLSATNWHIHGSCGAISVGRTATGRLAADGSIASITFGAANEIDVLAGVEPGVAGNNLCTRHADHPFDIVNEDASIGKIVIKGYAGAPAYLFVNSNFSSARIGPTILRNAQYTVDTTANSRNAFGLWARSIASVRHVDTRNTTDANRNWSWSRDQPPQYADLMISLLH